jgi:chromate transporter
MDDRRDQRRRLTERKMKLKKLWSLFFCFLKISAFTIGGGLAMVPLLMDQLVQKKQWLTEEEMADCLAISQTIPGAIVVNISVYIGRRVAGGLGTIAAYLGAVLPSLVCIIVILLFLTKINHIPLVTGFFKGGLAAAAGLVAVSCFRVGKGIIKRPGDVLLMLMAFGAVIFLRVSVLWIILAGCVMGCLLSIYRVSRRTGNRRGRS